WGIATQNIGEAVGAARAAWQGHLLEHVDIADREAREVSALFTVRAHVYVACAGRDGPVPRRTHDRPPGTRFGTTPTARHGAVEAVFSGLDRRARRFELCVGGLGGAAGVLGEDAEVVGRVFAEAGDRRRDGHVAGARAGRRRARRRFRVGDRGAVFERAFGHFRAVGVDQRVERGGGRGDRTGGFGFDRGLDRRARRFE